MHFMKAITGALALATCAALAPSAPAQTLQVLTAGSSAQFGPFAVAAYALAKTGGATAYHYTVKSGVCPVLPTTGCYAAVNDTRNSSIVPENGNLWVVWSSNGIWAYLSVDSTVGVRAFSAVPRAKLYLAALASLPLKSPTNYTYWADGTSDTALTQTVYNALNGTQFTAANTDIRPEDALFATNRSLNTLGYGLVADTRPGHSGQYLIGNPIIDHFNTADVAHPVSFAIAGGADPFGGGTGATEVTIPIGAAPIVFIANTLSGSTVANATNLTSAGAAYLFSGKSDCEASLITGATGVISPILREPLSGTMNTAEFSVFYSNGGSQETGITPPKTGTNDNNPLDLPCGSGFRYRAVGTGEEVNNVIATKSTVGYAFFSYESVGGGKTDKYLTLNSVDPLYSSTGQLLPTCPVVGGAYSCPVANGASFPSLRNGTYPAWSIYRVITDSAHQTTTQTLVTYAQNLVNSNIPDFVPFIPVCAAKAGQTNDPGLDVYREHFVPSTITTIPDPVSVVANDGQVPSSVTCKIGGAKTLPALALGGGAFGTTNAEEGGDVGGAIVHNTTGKSPVPPGPTQSSTH